MPGFLFGEPIITAEHLAIEKSALEMDSLLYLECVNNFLLQDRVTEQERRDGLILLNSVYLHIKQSAKAG